ncbi:putative non-metastatic cells 5 protein, partial [Operophtera brumata]
MSVASSESDAEYHSYSERTLATIKPEAYEDAEAIIDHITSNGFVILAKRIVHLTPEQAAEFYRGHYGRQHFPHLVAHMSNGPIVVLVLATRNCIQKWRTVMGPARYTCRGACSHSMLKHSLNSRQHSLRPRCFYNRRRVVIVGPIPRHWQVNDYIQKNITPTLLPALTALALERPSEPILWLAEHLRRNNPNEPEQAPQPSEQREDR